MLAANREEQRLLILAECLFASLLDPEDRGDTFFRNVGGLLPDYTASYPRK
jgi:hypothetical protein